VEVVVVDGEVDVRPRTALRRPSRQSLRRRQVGPATEPIDAAVELVWQGREERREMSLMTTMTATVQHLATSTPHRPVSDAGPFVRTIATNSGDAEV
jgi:hypothetical protein